MHIAILTFEGFNELDSLIAFGVLNRVKRPGWRVSIASPAAIHYMAPVGEKEIYVERALKNISPYLQDAMAASDAR